MRIERDHLRLRTNDKEREVPLLLERDAGPMVQIIRSAVVAQEVGSDPRKRQKP